MKKEMKKISAKNAANSFELIVREWHAKQKTKTNPNKAKGNWTDRHAKQVIERLEKNVFPFIGKYPVASIKAADVLGVLQRIEARQTYELAHRIMQICGQVCRYAVATGRAERNVVLDLQGALTPHKSEHHATITKPSEVGNPMPMAAIRAEIMRASPGTLAGAVTARSTAAAPYRARTFHRRTSNGAGRFLAG